MHVAASDHHGRPDTGQFTATQRYPLGNGSADHKRDPHNIHINGNSDNGVSGLHTLGGDHHDPSQTNTHIVN